MTTENRFDYGRMIAEALRSVAREALAHVAEEGLPGEHHFYLSFRPRGEGVHVPSFLRDQYAGEMTVVLQNQYWDLHVDDEGFSVTLAFGGSRHRIMVPWPQLTAFADPTAQLGLRFVPEEVPEGGASGDDGASAGKGTAGGAADEAASRWGGKGGLAAGDEAGAAGGEGAAADGDDSDGDDSDGDDSGGDDGEPGPAEEAAESAGDNVVRLDRFRRREDE